MDAFLGYSAKNKNKILLVTCLFIHIINALIFLINGSFVLVVVNAVSTAFYTFCIIQEKKRELQMAIPTYFEVLIFSVVSDLLAGGNTGYIYYVVGMVAIIFYMLPDGSTANRYLIQGIGVVICFVLFLINNSGIILLPNICERLESIRVYIRAYNFFIAIGTIVFVSCLYMMELDIAHKKLQFNVDHDELTGLYNRRFFERMVRDENKDFGASYAIVMFDIDDFKMVNDTYGHEIGDQVLEMVAKALMKNMGEKDVAVRWGGEEFILFFPNVDINFAERKTIQIQNDIRRNKVECDSKSVMITTTAGIAADTSIRRYESVISTADKRLYYGKRHGKNCHIKEDLE